MFSFCGILRFNRLGLFSDLLLFAVLSSDVSVSRPSTHRPFLCCCSSSDFLTVCIWFSQLGCFQLLNFNLGSNRNLVVSCFLGNFQFLFCCHASTTFSIGPTSFFDSLFYSSVSACSWQCSFCSFDSRLLLVVLFFACCCLCSSSCCWLCSFSLAVVCALLACCWLCSSRLLLAVLFCLLLAVLFCLLLAVLFSLLLAMHFCHFVPLSEILVDLLLVSVQVLRLCAPFRQSGFAFFVDFFSLLVFWL